MKRFSDFLYNHEPEFFLGAFFAVALLTCWGK